MSKKKKNIAVKVIAVIAVLALIATVLLPMFAILWEK